MMLINSDTDGLKAARLQMKEGQFSVALSLMINDLKIYPDNLRLLANIASCYYMTENYIQNKKYTFQLLNCYEKSKLQFPIRELRPSLLALVRLLEELGEVSLCLKVLKDFEFDQITEFDKYDTALIAQKLRLQASFSIDDENKIELYNHCRILNKTHHHSYVDIESALLLADWALFGEAIASDRLKKFTQNENLVDFQRRWLIFDHLYESLRTNKGINFDVNTLLQFAYLEVDPFEKFLWDQLLVNRNLQPQQDLILSRTDTMSTMGAFKILHLCMSYSNDSTFKKDISNKIGFLLNGVSPQSRALILKSYPIIDSSTIIEITPNHLTINGRVLPVQKCKSVHKLLTLLTSQRLQSTDSIIKDLCGENFDSSSYAKMRVMVARANMYLFKNSGLAKAFSINKESIELNRQLLVVKRAM